MWCLGSGKETSSYIACGSCVVEVQFYVVYNKWPTYLSGFEFSLGLEEGGSSSLISHLNKLYDAHLKKILKLKFG